MKKEFPEANMALDQKGQFYAELDTETNLYCVFGSETGFAYASFADEQEAKKCADKMNSK